MAENREYNSKDELIKQIISEEYKMFSEVSNIGGRASCQDDFDTFYIMRYAQHGIFTENTLKSYLKDIEDAQKARRNLITEKYSWMMEETDPVWFEEKLRLHLPQVSGRKMRLVESMTITFMNAWNNYLWPKVIMQGEDSLTMPMLVANLTEGYVTDYGVLMLAVLLCSLPTVIIFFLLQKSFAEGITGAVK